MRKTTPLIFVCLASVALAQDTEVAKPAVPTDKETTEEPAAVEGEATEAEEGDTVADEEAKLFAELEAAAAAEAQEEKERAAKVLSERAAAKGEKHETFTTVKGRVYKKVTIRGVDDLGVRIMHEAGTARIRFADCPVELQKRFGFDPELASEQADREKNRETERIRRAIARLRAESGQPGTTRKVPTTTARATPKTTPRTTSSPDPEPAATGDAPDLDLSGEDGDEALDIPSLEAKIAILEAGIEKIRKVGDEFEDKAKKLEDRLFAKNAGSTREPELDPKAMKEIQEWRDKADAEYDKVAKARRLISKHRKAIKKLERANK